MATVLVCVVILLVAIGGFTVLNLLRKPGE